MEMAAAVGSGLVIFTKLEIAKGRNEGLALVVGFGCVNADVMARRNRTKRINLDKLWCFFL